MWLIASRKSLALSLAIVLSVLLAEMARILGNEADAQEYHALFEKIRQAFITEFVGEDGRVRPEKQSSYVRALAPGRARRLLSYPRARSGAASASSLVLFVADLLHPIDRPAVESFLNGNVCHGRGWRGPMPMFLPWGEPDHISRTNVFNRASPALCPARTSRHNERLA